MSEPKILPLVEIPQAIQWVYFRAANARRPDKGEVTKVNRIMSILRDRARPHRIPRSLLLGNGWTSEQAATPWLVAAPAITRAMGFANTDTVLLPETHRNRRDPEAVRLAVLWVEAGAAEPLDALDYVNVRGTGWGTAVGHRFVAWKPTQFSPEQAEYLKDAIEKMIAGAKADEGKDGDNAQRALGHGVLLAIPDALAALAYWQAPKPETFPRFENAYDADGDLPMPDAAPMEADERETADAYAAVQARRQASRVPTESA